MMIPKPWYTTLPRLSYRGSPNQSSRHSPVTMVVVHDPEGSYEGALATILNPSAEVSYHALFTQDGTEGTQVVPWNRKAWSCVDYNSYSDNLSLAGFAGNNWSYSALNKFARAVAKRLSERGLPARYLSAPVGFPPPSGFTQHSELGTRGGGHHDMGLSGAKKWFFITSVKFHRRVGHFRPTWGRDN